MKKILLLGGSRLLLPVIDAAHKLGCYVITCDYLPNNAAHKYSDKYLNISIIEKEKVLKAADKLKIDGIMSYGCDPGVVSAAYVAEKLGLPSAGPYESVCILQNKGRFRNFLAENGFNTPMAKQYSDFQGVIPDTDMFRWPVIVKPTDSAGSKGVIKVNSPDDLGKSVDYALSFSHCGEFIIEEFVEKQGFSTGSDSFSVNGILKFVSFANQLFDRKAPNPYTPSGNTWPSLMDKAHKKELTSEIQRLLKLLKMRTSLYNIEARIGTDGKAYIMEVSPRGGGNRIAEVLQYATGVDLITNAVRAAIGEDVIGIEQKPYNGFWYNMVLHSYKKGKFAGLTVSDDIKDNIIEKDIWVNVGDEVCPFSAANAALGMIFFRFDTRDEMVEKMNDMEKMIRINVE